MGNVPGTATAVAEFAEPWLTGCVPQNPLNEDGYWVLPALPRNSYSLSSQVEVERTAVAPNTDLFFDWSTLTTDFLGKPMDPAADVFAVVVVLFNLTQPELTEKLNADELGASDSKGAMAIYTEFMRTSGETTLAPGTGSSKDFSIVGGGPMLHAEVLGRLDPNQWDPATHSFGVLVQAAGILGKDVKMVHVFGLDPTSTNTQVTITPDSTRLSYEASIAELLPVQVPLASNDVLLDWSDAEVNALGNEFVDRQVDEVVVTKYVGLTLQDMEARFLELEDLAVATYRGEVVAGSEFGLDELTSDTGEPFPGIDTEGIWVASLFCSRCNNPAPWYLTLLTPCAEAPPSSTPPSATP